MSEHWKLIPNTHYQASDLGRIRRWHMARRSPRKVLSQSVIRGYFCVGLRFADRRYTMRVHRLVCLAFNGVKPSGSECVRHRDGHRTNNVPSNLRWGTNLENAQDTVLHGRQVCGFDHPNVIITKPEAREIRRLFLHHMRNGRKKAANGFTKAVQEKYPHLTYRTVWKATHGRYDEME